MKNPIEVSGCVPLWAGWSADVPRGMCQRNENGSWSAWGHDWSIDVTIIECTPPSPEEAFLAVPPGGMALSGNGWRGRAEVLIEQDDGQPTFRFAASLYAAATVMLYWVSYRDDGQQEFARSLVQAVRHVPPGAQRFAVKIKTWLQA